MTRDAVERQLIDYIRDELLEDPRAELTPTTALAEAGLFDSFNILQLLAFSERAFGIRIPLEQLSTDDVRDVASVADLIYARR